MICQWRIITSAPWMQGFEVGMGGVVDGGRQEGGGLCGERGGVMQGVTAPSGIFLLGAAWRLSPALSADWENDPGAGRPARLATGSGHVESIRIRLSLRDPGRKLDGGHQVQCDMDAKPCVNTIISALHLFSDLSNSFSTFKWFWFIFKIFLSALVSVFLLLPPLLFLVPLCCPSSRLFQLGVHISVAWPLLISIILFCEMISPRISLFVSLRSVGLLLFFTFLFVSTPNRRFISYSKCET